MVLAILCGLWLAIGMVAMDQAIRVLVVEREPLLRRGLVSSLSPAHGFDVVADTDSRDEAHRILDRRHPEIVIAGKPMQDMSCIQLASDLRRHSPEVSTIVISSDENDDELFAAIRAGAAAYCDRTIAEAELHEVIRRCAQGEYVINEQLLNKPYVASRVLDQFRSSSQHEERIPDSFMPLTDRELEILRKVSTGLTNAEIGYTLGISPQTVKNHVTSILRKLAVNDRTQAVVTALRNGWLSIDDADGQEPARGANWTRAEAQD